ncbi:MAG: NAD(P)/FAD-dependent oxidoreductase, partial [Cyanobacteria bacterium P01_F01_bin.3]
MASAIIVGDGPAGLSAALFLAKKGIDTTVIGQDESWMHKALLLNYLGIPKMEGPQFMQACREQVTELGAKLVKEEVKAVAKVDAGFEVTTSQTHSADYLILATGPKHDLAESLGLSKEGKGIAADRDGKTAVDKLYVVGWSSR